MTRVLDPDDLGDHIDRLYRAAWAMTGSSHDAEDLVQETFARLLTRPRLVRGRDDLGYLLTALRNTYINSYRTKARRPVVVGLPDELPPVDLDPGAGPHERVRSREVLGHLRALPEELGAAITAVDLVGLSVAEAARALGTDARTLELRLFRARTSVSRHFAPTLS